ncbi:hypothetical protein HAX54_020624 [Datura stramonium]|uniref:Xylanase inhibitor C-terminal domain-containing protein n=1 Tax=Datura stramonium TaxID=4076 RepID=A0ABS8UTH0_DATST|nr:hypothetical protein [Datura stramonium]
MQIVSTSNFLICLLNLDYKGGPIAMEEGDQGSNLITNFSNEEVMLIRLPPPIQFEQDPSSIGLDAAGDGRIIVDSRTSTTRLTRPAYIAPRDAFRMGARDLKRAPDFSLSNTCFNLLGKTEVKLSSMVLHLRGADVSLLTSNYLIPVDNDSTFFFEFAGTMSGLSITGNIQQQVFRVVSDVANSRLYLLLVNVLKLMTHIIGKEKFKICFQNLQFIMFDFFGWDGLGET